ncbi:cytochrome P450 [Coprinopsis marcescibilis]|uniref:Cytochrome P450 n=1 Tax=Coprinopsis marcescibilis TaxID=230819 RepID=A0A5C3KL87_COPMA|nr:cytochrome P450 [Coprinopsis marcescibilis]
MPPLSLPQYLDKVHALSAGLFAFIAALYYIRRSVPAVRTPKHKGPPASRFLLGALADISEALNSGTNIALFDKWVKEYGPVFGLKMPFGSRGVAICDVKAAAHMLSKDTLTYRQMKFNSIIVEQSVGPGILWAEDEVHRRQRRGLTPAFSNSAIRSYVSVFYDSAYKIKGAWEAILDTGADTIEIQSWASRYALDNIGIAGFGYDFGSLDGNRPAVMDYFNALKSPEDAGVLSRILFLMGSIFPSLLRIPTEASLLLTGIKGSLKHVAEDMMSKAKHQIKTGLEKELEKSIIGLLIKSENATGIWTLSEEEVFAQVRTLLLAGYETSTFTVSWALIELCRNPKAQERLRKELAELGSDPTWEQMSYGLPYLNGVFQETIRLHAPLNEILRTAHFDDVIPLGKPITTASGEVITELPIAKGTAVLCSLSYINQSEELWGPDAKEFKPERWIEGEGELRAGAKAIPGYHHVLTFSDGPRICLGKAFAVASVKANLAVLIRNFEFALPLGPDTPIGVHKGILRRPKLVSEDGPRIWMNVRRVN